MNNEFAFDSLIKKMADEHQPELPSAALIWWRAQIRKKQAEKARVERPFRIMCLITAVIVVSALLVLWIGQAGQIRAMVGRVGAYPLFPLFFAGAAAVAIFLGLTWWTISEA